MIRKKTDPSYKVSGCAGFFWPLRWFVNVGVFLCEAIISVCVSLETFNWDIDISENTGRFGEVLECFTVMEISILC